MELFGGGLMIISGRRIGDGERPYVIAEIGINHGGSVAAAKQMIEAAARAGADAVKFQLYSCEEFLAPSSVYFDVLKNSEITAENISDFMVCAEKHGVSCFSSIFDEVSLSAVERMGVPAVKIASGDITHLPLLGKVASLGCPIILSTGGSSIGDVENALNAIYRENSGSSVALLHCVSRYPSDPSDLNLSCMATMRSQFGLPVGFSDHTVGVAAAISAVALGAEIIEKHFTLDKSGDGPDHQLSCDEPGLADLIAGVTVAWQARGRSGKAPVESADEVVPIRRSLNARKTLVSGDVLGADDIAVRRPGTGIQPEFLSIALGRRISKTVEAGAPILWSDIE